MDKIAYINICLAFGNIFLGIGPYILATLRGYTKPNRIAWLIFAIAPMIATAMIVIRGELSWSSLPVFMSGFGPFVVVLSSFFNKNSYWAISRWDIVGFVLSMVALIGWYFTQSTDIGVVFAILSDGIAGILFLYKSYKYPETESIPPFFMGMVSAGVALFFLQERTFTSSAFLYYLFSINILLILCISRKYFTKHI